MRILDASKGLYTVQSERYTHLLDAVDVLQGACACESGQRASSRAQRALNRHFEQLCAGAGVSRIHVYDLRHTATSLMIDAGADLKAASEALGHSDPGITMRVYRHVRADQRDHAIGALAAALDTPTPEVSGTP